MNAVSVQRGCGILAEVGLNFLLVRTHVLGAKGTSKWTVFEGGRPRIASG